MKNISNGQEIVSKLPDVGTTIFTVMSALANEHGAINLSQGFPNYSSDNLLIELVNDYMVAGYNQYAPMQGISALREALSQKIENCYQRKVNPDTEITITAGATQAIYTAISAFVHPGDEVIVLEPAYDSYIPSIQVNGGIPRIYEMQAPAYKVDWSVIRSMVNSKTKMIIINTPHNPTGTILKQEDLLELQKIVETNNLLVLSDEVYEHLIYDKEAHQSVLRFDVLYQKAMATYSFGKTFHNTGWKMGYCVGPPALMEEFRKVHQFNVFSCNTPVQYAMAKYLENDQVYMGLSQFYQQKRDFFLDAMKESPLRPITSKGTYFILFDYSHLSNQKDTDYVKWMTTDLGVAAIPVSVFYSNRRDDRVIRLCFAKTEDLLAKAAAKLNQI